MAFGAVSKPWHPQQGFDNFAPGYSGVKKTVSLTSFSENMDDDDLLDQLNTNDFESRLRALNRMRSTAAGNELWFKKFTKKLELFKAFANVLSDSNWEIQHQCIKFLLDTTKDYGNDLEWCMAVVMPQLVTKMASPKITVRRVAVHCLCSYAQRADSVYALQKAVVQYGLTAKEAKTVGEIVREVPGLFMTEFRDRSWALLCDGMTKFLLTSTDPEIIDLTLLALEKLLSLVGRQEFNRYVQTLPANQRNNYEVLLLERGTRNANAQSSYNVQTVSNVKSSPPDMFGGDPAGKQFRYGVIPVSIIEQIDNDADWQIRYNGLERLKGVVENLSESDIRKLQPHLFSYVNLIGNVLDDLSIKVVVITLEILRLSVGKLKQLMEPHLRQTVGVCGKHFGNQKIVVKQLNMMICMELMKHLRPKPVVIALSGFLQHRNSRVKEETLNVWTAAMLKFASGEFNLLAMAHLLTPVLADAKRRVRLASFECLAVLAMSMGQGKLEPLYKCIRDWEDGQNVAGLTLAVQARLAKRQLPKIKYDGLLEYSEFGLANHDDPKTVAHSNADINWIMSAGVGPGSAMSRSLSPNRFNRSQGQPPPGVAPSGRVLSAGKNRQKLPWENPPVSEPKLNNQNGATKQQNHANSPPNDFDSTAAKKMSLSFAKSNSNGRNVVLSPIDAKPPPKGTVVSANSVALSTKTLIESGFDRDELNESLNGVKWNAAKKRQEQQRQFSKAQSVESVASMSSEIHKDQWDDVPIKSKSAGNKIYSDEYASAPPNTILSPKKSLSTVPNRKFSIRRHSEDLTRSPENVRRVTQPVIVAAKKVVSPRKKVESQKSLTAPDKKALAVAASSIKSVKPPEDKDMNKPYNNPDQALQTALKKMSSEEWEDKVEGLNMVQRLAKYNTNVMGSNIHEVIVALNAEAKNLRSSVSKQAFQCYTHLFTCLKKSMDPEVDKICQVLVAKTGDASNAFIRDESLKALECMVDHVTPYKALFGFTVVGASHKNAVIRSACGQLMQRMVENLGSKKVFACQRDFVEKILLTAVQFANDSQPQPRLHGKTILMMLAQDPDFNNVLSKSVNGNQQDTIRNIVGGAKMKASLSVNGISNASGSKVQHPGRSGSIRRKAKIPDEAADSILSAEKELASGNWEERFKGVNRFASLCDSYGSYVGNNVKMLETYMQRLNDINGKVALVALENLPPILSKIQPHLADALRPVATEMVKNLAAQLPAKNDDVRKAAEKCLDASVKILDNSALIQPISIMVKSGNSKQKPKLINSLGKICQNIYASKSKLVQMHALPVLNDLLKSQLSDSDIRQAAVDLAKILSKTMGRKVLLEQSAFGPSEKAALENIV